MINLGPKLSCILHAAEPAHAAWLQDILSKIKVLTRTMYGSLTCPHRRNIHKGSTWNPFRGLRLEVNIKGYTSNHLGNVPPRNAYEVFYGFILNSPKGFCPVTFYLTRVFY